MKTLLVLLVGTNPLPVWVAWKCLKDRLGQIEKILLVYTKETEGEFNRLAKLIEIEIGRTQIIPALTEPGAPGRIQRDIGQIIASLPQEITDIHVHYTGGTKVMAVATVEITRDFCRNTNRDFGASYLDPRAGEGPKIIDDRGEDIEIDPRKKIGADLRLIAELNGFQIGEFEYEYRGISKRAPVPSALSEGERRAGRIWLKGMSGEMERGIRSNTTKWRENTELIDKGKRVFQYPAGGVTFHFTSGISEELREELLTPLSELYQNGSIHAKYGQMEFNSKNVASAQEQKDLEALNRFLTGGWLEFAAYDALRTSLDNVGARTNFAVFNAVYVKRAGKSLKAKPFELDVVALLGYQILVVSCSASTIQEEIKKKGMEALARARQLGGDEARAIVLCPLYANIAQLIENELHDEMGSLARPLQIWGRNRWRNSTDSFSRYLSQLAWI